MKRTSIRVIMCCRYPQKKYFLILRYFFSQYGRKRITVREQMGRKAPNKKVPHRFATFAIIIE